MSNLKSFVTPLTRGIIWFTNDETNSSNPHYGEIDYLLDGLLTANLRVGQEVSSRVIIGQNFDKPFYVLIIRTPKPSEIESFVSLFKKQLGPEDEVVVIDEWEGLRKLKNELKEIINNLKTIQ
jgi:hypothetical protein